MTADKAPYTVMIRDLPTEERPRERLRHHGARSLNTAELVAILLRTGMKGENVLTMANRIIARFNGLSGIGDASYTELAREKGLSEAKACQLMAAFELGRRMMSLSPGERTTISSPHDVVRLLGAEMGAFDQEHFRVVLLSTRNEVLSQHDIYVGSVHTAVVRIAEVLRPAIRENAPSMVAVHNHPTGNTEPSREDVSMTLQVRQAAELMNIELIDHVIIGKGGGFSSLKEQNLGFH